jgi:hypothetical protein
MSRLRCLIPLALAVAASILVVVPVAGAEAAPVTVGSPLSGTVTSGKQAYNETFIDLAFEEAGAAATSPVNGAIVSWNLLGFEGGPFALRVLRPVGSTAYTAVGSSNPVVAAGLGLQTFAIDLPVQAGDTIGLDAAKGATLGYIFPAPLSAIAAWMPFLPEGATQAYLEGTTGAEVAFDAEVQAAPTIASFGPESGSESGGTAVTISGTDFEGVTAVDFGPSPAASYTVDSEGQITAVSPAGAGTLPISVTTIAGKATSGGQFSYPAPSTPGPAPTPIPTMLPPSPPRTCTVPNLRGKTLGAAKRMIKGADCKVGKVTKKNGATAKSGKVVGQTVKPGTVRPAGAVVKVTLAKA